MVEEQSTFRSLLLVSARSATRAVVRKSSSVRAMAVPLLLLLIGFSSPVAFKVYDMDRDGLISNGELFLVLKMMVGNNLKDQQLQQIVDKTIMEADKDGCVSDSGKQGCFQRSSSTLSSLQRRQARLSRVSGNDWQHRHCETANTGGE